MSFAAIDRPCFSLCQVPLTTGSLFSFVRPGRPIYWSKLIFEGGINDLYRGDCDSFFLKMVKKPLTTSGT